MGVARERAAMIRTRPRPRVPKPASTKAPKKRGRPAGSKNKQTPPASEDNGQAATVGLARSFLAPPHQLPASCVSSPSSLQRPRPPTQSRTLCSLPASTPSLRMSFLNGAAVPLTRSPPRPRTRPWLPKWLQRSPLSGRRTRSRPARSPSAKSCDVFRASHVTLSL